jgi:DNA-binding IclR family transcriptional regulator
MGMSAVVEQLAEAEVITSAERTVLRALAELPSEDRVSSKWQAMAEAAGVPERTFYRSKQDLLERGLVTGGGGRGQLYQPVEEG